MKEVFAAQSDADSFNSSISERPLSTLEEDFKKPSARVHLWLYF